MIVIPVMLVAIPREIAVATRLAGVFLQEFDKLFRLLNRQTAQHQSIDQSKDRSVGANPKAQREQGNGCEAEAAAHHSQGVTNVLPEDFEGVPEAHALSVPIDSVLIY